MTVGERHSRAVAVAVEVAAEHGLAVREPTVLADGSNTLVHLRPYPIVARVATFTGSIRPDGGRSWLAREVRVLRHLAGREAMTLAAELPAGPHRRHGFCLVYLGLVAAHPRQIDPVEIGRSLRRLHSALADYHGRLPRLGMLDEVGHWLGMLGPDDLPAPLCRELDRRRRDLRSEIDAARPVYQPVHGDAHLGNLLTDSAGPRWIDFEDVHSGPIEWDLACLVAGSRRNEALGGVGGFGVEAVNQALRAYGVDPADGFLALLVRARTLVGVAWALLRHRGEPDRRMADRAAVDWFLAVDRR